MDINITYTIIVGIVSSLVATAIFIILSELFRKVFIPWYEDRIYKGTRIDGLWKLSEIDNEEILSGSDMFFSLVQHGENIYGKYSHKSSDGEIDNYILSGKLRDMYFLSTAVPESKRLIDGISVLMHLDFNNNKLTMNGSILYKSSPGTVDSANNLKFIWKSI